MKFAPDLPPPAAGIADRWEVKALAAAEPLKPLQGGPAAQALVRTQPIQRLAEAPLVQTERRSEGVAERGRRLYSRRIMRYPMLLELRSAISRRRRRQRRGDKADTINEFV